MIDSCTENEYIQILYKDYCKNDYEINEMRKWIKEMGIDYVYKFVTENFNRNKACTKKRGING